MAKWEAKYTPLTDINNGNKYEKCDGIRVSDINKLFENVKYLKERNDGKME